MRATHIITMLIRCNSTLRISPQMKTWQIYKYGDIDQLTLSETYQTPAISSPNQVLIKVTAASVNPIDVHITRGYGASAFNIMRKLHGLNEFPVTLGRDFSGTVVKVGRSVHTFLPGNEVIGALWPYEQGCHSDYVVCNQSQLALKPQKLSHYEAASIPYAGLTAYSALVDFGGLKAGNGHGKRVLILGAGGGVGTIAVQIVKSFGAHVTVTCRPHSEEMLTKLGADAILQHGLHNDKESKFDLIFDCIGDNVANYGPMLKSCPNSRFVTIKHQLLEHTDKYSPFIGVGIASLEFAKTFLENALRSNGAIYQWAFFRASGSNLMHLSHMVDRGSLVPVVQDEFDFDDAPQAYEAMKSGGRQGKVIIRMNDDQEL